MLEWIIITLLITLVAARPLITELDNSRGDYIVVFKGYSNDHPGASLEKRFRHISWLEKMVNNDKNEDENDRSIYGYIDVGLKLSGYHGRFTPDQIKKIQQSQDVAFVEKDSTEEIQSVVYLQSSTPWGLSRISHIENQYINNRKTDYLFKVEGGKGSTIYILDTGVMLDHKEFQGRIRWGANFANDLDTDENGHGTHVAGVAAGYSVGVAKFADIVAVKILDARQRGTLSNFIKAMAWIVNDHKAHPGQRSIINYSAVGEISQARNMAINEAVNAGIFFVGAAGNKAADACNFGPPSNNNGKASTGQLIVAALNYTDHPASFSNYGSCVDVFAPGVNIRSAVNRASNAYGTMSGTSMASPHVAGLVAYYWSLDNGASHGQLAQLITDSNHDRIKNNLPQTVNKIAYNNA